MPQSSDPIAAADRTSRRVLLVVDSATVALFVRTLLDRWGMMTQAADVKGTDLPDLEGIDLAIVDAGCRNADAVVAACTERAIPVLALLPAGMSLAGVKAEIVLPISAPELHEALLHCLDRNLMHSLAEAGIDADEIVALWGGTNDPRFLRVAGVFIAELENRLPLLPLLLSKADRAGLELQAHSIKGAATNVGATTAHAVALKLESLSQTGSVEELAALVTDLHGVARMAMARLRTLIDAHQG